MIDYILKEDNFIGNKTILLLLLLFGYICTIKYQICDDYYTEECSDGPLFRNMFLCGKVCGIYFN